MSEEAGDNSQRYELKELFPDEEDYTLDLLKIVGSMIVIVLLLAALAYPFIVSAANGGH